MEDTVENKSDSSTLETMISKNVDLVSQHNQNGEGEVGAGPSSPNGSQAIKSSKSRSGLGMRRAAVEAQKRMGEMIKSRGSRNGIARPKRKKLHKSSPKTSKLVGRQQRRKYQNSRRSASVEDANFEVIDLTISVTDIGMQTDNEVLVQESLRSASNTEIAPPQSDVFIFGGNPHSRVPSRANYNFAQPTTVASPSSDNSPSASPPSSDESFTMETSCSASPFDANCYYVKPRIHFAFSIPAPMPATSTTYSTEMEQERNAQVGEIGEEHTQEDAPQPGPGAATPHVNFFQTINNTFKQFFNPDSGKSEHK